MIYGWAITNITEWSCQTSKRISGLQQGGMIMRGGTGRLA